MFCYANKTYISLFTFGNLFSSGQFGKIDFSGGLFMAFFTATLYSITDSIADYHACAKMARVPPPPIHAINRGIMVEGCLTMISGFFGAGHATSTYGEHIGSIGITKVSVRYDCLP